MASRASVWSRWSERAISPASSRGSGAPERLLRLEAHLARSQAKIADVALAESSDVASAAHALRPFAQEGEEVVDHGATEPPRRRAFYPARAGNSSKEKA